METKKPTAWRLLFASNDPDSGSPMERFESAQVEAGDAFMGWGLNGPPTVVHYYDKSRQLVVGRIAVPAIGWVGSWRWDGALVRSNHGIRVLRYLAERRFEVDDGPAEIDDAWPFDGMDDEEVVQLIERAAR